MRKHIKILNYLPAVLSVVAAIPLWSLCSRLSLRFGEQLPHPILIALFFTLLFGGVFLVTLAASLLSGSFDRNSVLYGGFPRIALYFVCGILSVFLLSGILEYLYELSPKLAESSPTSYIIVTDESGSMETNDPHGLRHDAIPELLDGMPDDFPYMIYAFSGSPHIVRDMSPISDGYDWQQYCSTSETGFLAFLRQLLSGGTAIRTTVQQILDDCKNGVWKGGKCPKVIFLTDGWATDMNSFFLWRKKDLYTSLHEYQKLGITISTVGLGDVDRTLMQNMANITGGIFVHCDDASQLSIAMKSAAVSFAERDLLSPRHISRFNALYGLLRILFLTLIGTLLGSLMTLAYTEDTSIRLICLSSAICATVGGLLMELGSLMGVPQTVLCPVLFPLLAVTLGYRYLLPEPQGITVSAPRRDILVQRLN